MAEVLSQQEIDQLLNKVKSGEEEVAPQNPEPEATPFDFRLPNRISKLQLRTIKNIFDNFAESFSQFLVTKLQTIVSINVTTVDQIYYSEYVLSVSNPACLFTFEIEKTDIKGILELSPDLAICIVDRLLGGNGMGTKQSKMITSIEQKVLTSVVEKVMYDLKKAWKVVDNFEFVAERFESDIDFAQITSQSDSVLLVSLEILIGEQSYLLNICFATYAFDVLLSRLSSQKMSTVRPVKYAGTTSQEILTNHLYQTNITLAVEFGKSKISMDDLLALEAGDIIKLETKIDEDLLVKAGNINLFYGRPGVVNKQKAIKITRRITPESK